MSAPRVRAQQTAPDTIFFDSCDNDRWAELWQRDRPIERPPCYRLERSNGVTIEGEVSPRLLERLAWEWVRGAS